MRELPRTLKTATVFGVVFTVVFLAVLAWEREQEKARFVIQGGKVQLHRAADGHYHWPGSISAPGPAQAGRPPGGSSKVAEPHLLGGEPVDFLVDTGASGSAIPLPLAEKLSLPQLGTITTQTAGGEVQGRVVVAELALEGGVRVDRLRIVALPGLAKPLLGMDVLGRLRFQQEAGVLKFDLGGTAR